MPANPVAITTSFGLTEMEADFLRAFLRSGKKEESARAAGYQNPGVMAHTVLRLPHVSEALQYELGRLLKVEDAPRARRIMLDILEDPQSGARVRADVAKTIMNLAGYVAPSKAVGDDPEKQLSEMTQEELHAKMGKGVAEIDRLEQELAARAKQVNAPNAPGIAPNPSDILD